LEVFPLVCEANDGKNRFDHDTSNMERPVWHTASDKYSDIDPDITCDTLNIHVNNGSGMTWLIDEPYNDEELELPPPSQKG
jgi:hypothetical protein